MLPRSASCRSAIYWRTTKGYNNSVATCISLCVSVIFFKLPTFAEHYPITAFCALIAQRVLKTSYIRGTL